MAEAAETEAAAAETEAAAEPAGFKLPSRPVPVTPRSAEGGEPGPSPSPPARPAAAPAAPRYEEPSWGSRPPAGAGYGLEVLKGGVALGSVRLEGGSWFLVGRLPGCALSLEHPSVSRHHAVLQYRGVGGSTDGPAAADAAGFYVYDLGSTHGTFLNKARVPPRTYCRVRVGHALRFGGSSRLFLLQVSRGPGAAPGSPGGVTRVGEASPAPAQGYTRLPLHLVGVLGRGGVKARWFGCFESSPVLLWLFSWGKAVSCSVSALR